MSLNETPRGDRLHIVLFGKTNVGKSSLINALTNQDIALVSPISGTTTDPVYKSMELLPLGPVVIIDTAGLDDTSELGQLRITKSLDCLNKADICLIVVEDLLTEIEEDLIVRINQKNIPYLIIQNKVDLNHIDLSSIEKKYNTKVIKVSTITKDGINALKDSLGNLLINREDKFRLVGDLVNPGDFVILVTPIDKAAPKGRLILPQQQVIRDLLEADAIPIVTKEHELKETLENLKKKPKLVITDSQVFLKVSADTPKDINLTSFSILFARFKGELMELVQGAKQIDNLNDGDKVLIAEGCTHHRQSDDIGTVKLPRWIRQYTGKDIDFEFSSGISFPSNLDDYKLIIMCGSCMLNRNEVLSRINSAQNIGIPIVNYGVAIAQVQGILKRSLSPFPYLLDVLEEQ